jgi:hypothetical protein
VIDMDDDYESRPPVTRRRRIVEAVLLLAAFVYVPFALWRVIEVVTR